MTGGVTADDVPGGFASTPGIGGARRAERHQEGGAIAAALGAAHTESELGAFIAIAESPASVRYERSGGPLQGVPVAVKDNIDTRDFATTGGTRALEFSRPHRDHPAVARLRSVGAGVIGKTNLHELALGITSNNAAYGPVRNPHDLSRSAGGSSGGSAAAVAAGIVPIALGTDTGGSMRIPAAHCGVVGFRPTTGRWGLGGVVPISHTRDTVGVFATSVHDVDVVDRLVTRRGFDGPEARTMIRLGVPRQGFFDDLDPAVKRGIGQALDLLDAAGCELLEVEVRGAHELDERCGFPIVFYELVRDLSAYLASLPGPECNLSFNEVLRHVASPDVHAAMQHAVADPVPESLYVEACATRDILRQSYASALGVDTRHQLDALVFPTTPLLAPLLGDDDTTPHNGRDVPVFTTSMRNTGPGSTAGMPSVSVPVPSEGSLPIGLCVEGWSGDDLSVLRVAARVEEVFREQ
ncbi:MAG: amidase family protein [Nocardioides sp.]|uniref:amidase family protein n=1 Tax=Nocardioides sp. TaxID=35761 RepID=UPI0039E33A1C